MHDFWSRFSCYAGPYLRWWHRPQLLGGSPIQGGLGEAEGNQGVAAFFPGPDSSVGLRRTKLWLCGLALALTFIGWFLGKDPSQLQVIVPSIIAAYCAAAAYTDGMNRKYPNGTGDSLGSGNNGG